MTDLVQKLVWALEEARDLLEKHASERGHGCSYTARECHPTAFARIDAALSEAKAGGWKPIETCPRDFGSTKFDVWANGQRYADCWWGKATYEQGESGIVHQSDYDCNGPVDSYVKGAIAWQPLPAPPAQRGESK